MATPEGIKWAKQLNSAIESDGIDFILEKVEKEYKQVSGNITEMISEVEKDINASRNVDNLSTYPLGSPQEMKSLVAREDGINDLDTTEIILGTCIMKGAHQGSPPKAKMPNKLTKHLDVDQRILDAGMTIFKQNNIGIASYNEEYDTIKLYNIPGELLPSDGIMHILADDRIPMRKLESILQHEMTHAYVGGKLRGRSCNGEQSAINEAAAWGIQYMEEDPVNPEKYRDKMNIPVDAFNIAQRIFYSRVEDWESNGLGRDQIISRLRKEAVEGVRRLDEQSVDVVEALAPDKVRELKMLQGSIYHYEKAETRAIDALRWLGFAYQGDRRNHYDELDPENEIDLFGYEVKDMFQDEIERYRLGNKAKKYDNKVQSEISGLILEKPDFEPKSVMNQLAQARKQLNQIEPKTETEKEHIKEGVEEISKIMKIYSEGVPAPSSDLIDGHKAKQLLEKPSDYSSLREYDVEFSEILEKKLNLFGKTLERAEDQIERIENLERMLDQKLVDLADSDQSNSDLYKLHEILKHITKYTEKMEQMIETASGDIRESISKIEEYKQEVIQENG